MTRKRSKLELYLEVLRVISRGETLKTRIMYRANLSWVPLGAILASCLDQGLIGNRSADSRPRYYITEKGLRTLVYFENPEFPLDYSKTA